MRQPSRARSLTGGLVVFAAMLLGSTDIGSQSSAADLQIALHGQQTSVHRDTLAQPQLAEDDSSSATEKHVRRIEQGETFAFDTKHPAFRLTLEKLMDFCNAPGVSVAVIDQYRIAWAKVA